SSPVFATFDDQEEAHAVHAGGHSADCVVTWRRRNLHDRRFRSSATRRGNRVVCRWLAVRTTHRRMTHRRAVAGSDVEEVHMKSLVMILSTVVLMAGGTSFVGCNKNTPNPKD